MGIGDFQIHGVENFYRDRAVEMKGAEFRLRQRPKAVSDDRAKP